MFLFIFMQFSLINYGQIIADHTSVDKYSEIPQQYLDEVKKMLVDLAGESHASGYRIGQNLLELLDNKYQVLIFDGAPPAYTDKYLRFGEHAEVGEAGFYTSQTSIDAYKAHITSQNTTGNVYSVMGFGWCWDMTWLNVPGGGLDPVYNVRWAGASVGGPNGNQRWGLDNGDQTLTENSVCMDTYLNAVEQYNQHCVSNGYNTKIIFTTGPVDDGYGTMAGTENGFQREIKHDYIRNYVASSSSRILFDYADILCWNNSGVEYITNWNDGGTIRTHANIHPDNMKDYDGSWNMISYTEDGDHIGEVGALRLAKAMWWMLARIAGWDGGTTAISEQKLRANSLFTVTTTPNDIRIIIDDSILPAKVCISNLQGKLIAEQKAYSNLVIFQNSNLPAGIYFIVVSNSKFNEARKIVIS